MHGLYRSLINNMVIGVNKGFEKRLSLIVPLVLAVIFLILYFQFKSVTTSLMVFSGVATAFSGGFLMLWLYGQGWFAFACFLVALDDVLVYVDNGFHFVSPQTSSQAF